MRERTRGARRSCEEPQEGNLKAKKKPTIHTPTTPLTTPPTLHGDHPCSTHPEADDERPTGIWIHATEEGPAMSLPSLVSSL